MLDDRQRDTDDVGFLEAVCPDQVGADLAGDEDHRNRVHHRVCDRGDEVGRARSGGAEGDAGTAGSPGITLRGMAGGLLVAGLDMAQVGSDQGVVRGQVCTAGDPEDVIYALGLEGSHHCVCGSHRSFNPSSEVRFSDRLKARRPRARPGSTWSVA